MFVFKFIDCMKLNFMAALIYHLCRILTDFHYKFDPVCNFGHQIIEIKLNQDTINHFYESFLIRLGKVGAAPIKNIEHLRT